MQFLWNGTYSKRQTNTHTTTVSVTFISIQTTPKATPKIKCNILLHILKGMVESRTLLKTVLYPFFIQPSNPTQVRLSILKTISTWGSEYWKFEGQNHSNTWKLVSTIQMVVTIWIINIWSVIQIMLGRLASECPRLNHYSDPRCT